MVNRREQRGLNRRKQRKRRGLNRRQQEETEGLNRRKQRKQRGLTGGNRGNGGFNRREQSG